MLNTLFLTSQRVTNKIDDTTEDDKHVLAVNMLKLAMGGLGERHVFSQWRQAVAQKQIDDGETDAKLLTSVLAAQQDLAKGIVNDRCSGTRKAMRDSMVTSTITQQRTAAKAQADKRNSMAGGRRASVQVSDERLIQAGVPKMKFAPRFIHSICHSFWFWRIVPWLFAAASILVGNIITIAFLIMYTSIFICI